MPEENRQSGAATVRAPAVSRRSGSYAGRLVRRLQLLGFTVPAVDPANAVECSGVPIRAPIQDLLQCRQAFDTLARTVCAMLARRVPLTLSLTSLGRESEVIDRLRDFCELLHTEIRRRDLLQLNSLIVMSIYSHLVPLKAFELVTSALLGSGPRYVLLDCLQMKSHAAAQVAEETAANWTCLWQRRALHNAVRPTYGSTVATGCPLLADEIAPAILPRGGLQVPAESAWLNLDIDIAAFADGDGEIELERLATCLDKGVELADRLCEQLSWPLAAQDADARFNRRLAIRIRGLGNCVALRCLDPADFATLRWLNGIVSQVRQTLWSTSRKLAKRYGPLPALADARPVACWDDTRQGQDWYRCWQSAVAASAVRFRNMLVISPYAVIPTFGKATTDYTDLLPVIAFADAWSFDSPPAFREWRVQDFATFHRRAWAVIQSRNEKALIAAGV